MALKGKYSPVPRRSTASKAVHVATPEALLSVTCPDMIGALIAVFDPDGAELDPIGYFADRHLPGRSTMNGGTVRLGQATVQFERLLGGVTDKAEIKQGTLMTCVQVKGSQIIFNPRLLRQCSESDAARAIEGILRTATDGWRDMGREASLMAFGKILAHFMPAEATEATDETFMGNRRGDTEPIMTEAEAWEAYLACDIDKEAYEAVKAACEAITA